VPPAPIAGQVGRGTLWVQRVGNPLPRYTVISDSNSPLRPWLK
jgi:hypothetical protein